MADEAVTADLAARDLALADRYAALGFSQAARAVCERVAKRAPSGAALSRLVERCLAEGDGAAARSAAEKLCALDRSPGARLLLGRAQLFIRELAAARRTFAGVCESAASRCDRSRAHLGLCEVASAQGDSQGAGAQAMAAWDALVAEARAQALDADALPLATAIVRHILRYGREDDAREAVAPGQGAMVDVLRQIVAPGADNDVDTGSPLPESLDRAARALFAGHKLRTVRRSATAQNAAAIADLGALERELSGADLDAPALAMLARVRMALAAALEADPQTADKAAELYQQVLALQPAHAGAANNLAQLALAAGDPEAAIEAAAQALAASPKSELCWLSFARALSLCPAALSEAHLAQILEAIAPGIGKALAPAAARLYHATATVARESVLAGVHTRGHRMKNAVGIIGARVRSARKLADQENSPKVAQKLDELAGEVTATYDEWARYLRSVEATAPAFESLSIPALMTEVMAGFSASEPAVSVTVAPAAMPDVRGDRLLLSEAIHNLVANAVDACRDTSGRVEVTVRYLDQSAMPAIAIEVADTGPGIAAADLARIFAPGFTTKPDGSGIGLAVVERVITAHRGRLLVDSAPDKGTRMTIVLPCAGEAR